MKKIIISLILLVAVAISVVMQACGGSVFGDKISEGVITYKLEYNDSNPNSSLIMMLPPQMTMSFKDNSTMMAIKGYVGCFVLNTIANYSKRQNYTTLSVGLFDQKYLLVNEFGDAPFGTDAMSDIVITQKPDTMSICGYLCHKAEGYSEQCKRNFTFWYTKDLDINSDCILSPVKSIDGVMMEFEVEMMGIYMKARAVEVSRMEIPDEIFEKPEGFREVTRAQLEDVIHTFDGSKSN